MSGQAEELHKFISKIASIGALLILSSALAACSSVSRKPTVRVIAPIVQPVPVVSPEFIPAPEPVSTGPDYVSMYGEVTDNGWTIPALDVSKMAERNLRKEVDYYTDHPVGTIIVDPHARYLYLVQPGGKAIRYSVGVGRAGLVFNGEAKVAYKAQWPRWTPTANMIKRNPDHYAKYAGGLEGGIRNPLGARALYLYRDGKDTLYRIHGTNEPWSVGKAASSGCIRLYNQDILDLHSRVTSGASVVVLSKAESGKGT